jgi:hypothetical protein
MEFLISILQHKTGGQSRKVFGVQYNPPAPHHSPPPQVYAWEIQDIPGAILIRLGRHGIVRQRRPQQPGPKNIGIRRHQPKR